MKYREGVGVIVPLMQKYYKLLILAAAALFTATIAVMSLRTSAATTVIYDAIPDVLPSSYPSLGYQATGTSEFGDLIEFAGTERNLGSATVTMVSWACQSGAWQNSDCVSTPGATFKHPITLNLYNVDSGAPGSKIASITQNFDIPFRPTADPTCDSSTQWRNDEGDCQNGYASNITFDLSGISVPDQVIYGIAYNTQTYGDSPEGVDGPYNSLNVGLEDNAVMPTVGTDVDNDSLFWNSSTYGDGTFKLDSGWSPYTIAIQFDAWYRSAEITAPEDNAVVSGSVDFKAYLDDDDADNIQWAVRQGTCAAGTNTVFGNVDGKTNVAVIDQSDLSNQTFEFTADMSGLLDGMYCFIYNPREDAGETNIRLTSEFILDNVVTDKEGCKNGLWVNGIEDGSFRNQGDCVSYFATMNSSVGPNPATDGATNERANSNRRR